MTDETRTLAGQISEWSKQRAAGRDSSTSLERPSILDDAKADPLKQAEAADNYTTTVMNRQTLTDTEKRFLGAQINRALRGEE
jgi:hypothetical protein